MDHDRSRRDPQSGGSGKGDLRDGSAVGRFHIVVGASAGVALVGPLDTAADALARADTAMYAPKIERRRSLSASPWQSRRRFGQPATGLTR